MGTLAIVVQLSVCFATVVVNAVDPVAVHNNVPVALLSCTLARGNTVPTLAVFLIHRLKLTVEPLGIAPLAPGTPVCVSNSLILYSPAALPPKAVVRATLLASGLEGRSLSNVVLIVEASLCSLYVACWPLAFPTCTSHARPTHTQIEI